MLRVEDQVKMFGCSIQALKDAAEPHEKYPTELLMFAMGILSDAQEVLARGDSERSRQYMNRAKYIISEVRRSYR